MLTACQTDPSVDMGSCTLQFATPLLLFNMCPLKLIINARAFCSGSHECTFQLACSQLLDTIMSQLQLLQQLPGSSIAGALDHLVPTGVVKY